MKVKGLRIPDDVVVELLTNGEPNFFFHSKKGQAVISQMGEIEKLKFAIAVTAKKDRLK